MANYEDRFAMSFEGMLLLAEPSMQDTFFHKSVILLTRHEVDTGAYGFVINYPLQKSIDDELLKKNNKSDKHIFLYRGGPIHTDEIIFCHLFWDKKRKELGYKTHISKEEAAKLAKKGEVVRAFLGHSGWTPYQLETEIKHKSWIPYQPKNEEFLQFENEETWSNILNSMGPWYSLLAKTPDNPSLN